MNVEECRLNTFRDWPENAGVESCMIAQAGFYFTGPGLKVTCFSCGCHISDWNYGDQAMARHRIISPNCAFIRDPINSGNIPRTINRSILHSSRLDGNLPGRCESQPSIYKSETARLQSFNGWPIPSIVTPEALARAGFFYLHQGDKVQCAFCTGIICHWEKGDVPEIEHRRHFSACQFVLGGPVGNIPRKSFHRKASIGKRICAFENLKELGDQRHRGPKHPKFSTFESRLRTFTNCPSDLAYRSSEVAKAGFFCTERGPDSIGLVRCFHCDGELKHWGPQHEPWIEHARFYPTCPFLLLVKGQEFVNEFHSKSPVEAGTSSSEPKPVGLQGTLSASMPNLSNYQGNYEELSSTQSQIYPVFSRESLSLEEENRRLRWARQCKICMETEINELLFPCGHLVACSNCVQSLRTCPVCRRQISTTIRTYLS